MTKAEEAMAAEMETLRGRTGLHSSSDPLVVFLYLLLRDSVPCGVVEEKVCEAVISCRQADERGVGFTNGYLVRYARDISARLKQEVSVR